MQPSSMPASGLLKDPAAMQALTRSLRRRLLGSPKGDRSLRVWVPEAGAGEDAYAAAVCAFEAMEGGSREVDLRVFATDGNESRLAAARAGRFTPEALSALPEKTARRYFHEVGGALRPRPLLRQALRFARHEGLAHSPFSQLDLIACRGSLSGVPGEAREELVKSLCAALREGGLLHGLGEGLDAQTRGRRETARRESLGPAGSGFDHDVVHELRAPVAIIQGYAETLRLGVARKSDRDGFLRSIESQTARMSRLVDRLLTLSSQLSAPKARPERVPLSEALWSLARGFAPAARRRGIAIRVEVAAGLAALADPETLPHLFGNLLDNAVKFSRRRGAVRVAAVRKAGLALVTVRDAGPGIPDEDLPRLFERFFRSSRTRRVRGTGLGLAIARAAAASSGGRVWAGNHPEGGAVFTVSLPLAPEPS